MHAGITKMEFHDARYSDMQQRLIDVRERPRSMTQKPNFAPAPFGDIAPALAKYTDEVLFGDVWRRPGLSPRDRSVITLSSLVSLYRTNELPFHIRKALEHGVTRDEIIELITHLAFYSGWPTAATALTVARNVFDEDIGGRSI